MIVYNFIKYLPKYTLYILSDYVYISFYLSIYLYNHQSIYLYNHRSIYLSNLSLLLFIYLFSIPLLWMIHPCFLHIPHFFDIGKTDIKKQIHRMKNILIFFILLGPNTSLLNIHTAKMYKYCLTLYESRK